MRREAAEAPRRAPQARSTDDSAGSRGASLASCRPRPGKRRTRTPRRERWLANQRGTVGAPLDDHQTQKPKAPERLAAQRRDGAGVDDEAEVSDENRQAEIARC